MRKRFRTAGTLLISNSSGDPLAFHRRALTDAEIRGLFLQRTAGRCHGTDNRAPVLDAPADRASVEGDTIVPLALGAHDPDGDTLSYSATGLPWGLSIDVATGLIRGTLGTDPYGQGDIPNDFDKPTKKIPLIGPPTPPDLKK